MTICTIVYV